MVSVTEIMEALEGAELPKTKKEIIRQARDRKARVEVIEVLNTLPNAEYRSMAGIWDGIGRSY